MRTVLCVVCLCAVALVVGCGDVADDKVPAQTAPVNILPSVFRIEDAADDIRDRSEAMKAKASDDGSMAGRHIASEMDKTIEDCDTIRAETGTLESKQDDIDDKAEQELKLREIAAARERRNEELQERLDNQQQEMLWTVVGWCVVGGLAAAGVGVFLFVQGMGKLGIGLAIGGVATAAGSLVLPAVVPFMLGVVKFAIVALVVVAVVSLAWLSFRNREWLEDAWSQIESWWDDDEAEDD